MEPVHALSIVEIGKKIRSGELSPVAVVEDCLSRIEHLDPAIHAWVHVEGVEALKIAAVLAAEARGGKIRGPLHGIPVGLKDIIHVAGMKTTAGAGEFAHECPQTDSAVAARLRRAGAVILGKTATTEFAYADPTTTRNPWNLEHTPGGSSSGSAAAVAAGMIPLAIGSQTGGSTIRPAGYCGVVGLKPTRGRISTAGIIPVSPSLDHVGILTRRVEDAACALSMLAGYDPEDGCSAHVPTTDYLSSIDRLEQPPRFGVPIALFRDAANSEVITHTETVISTLRDAGATVDEVQLPHSAGAIREATTLVMRVEGATFHADRFARYADLYRPKMRAFIEAGLAVPATQYVRAQQTRRQFKSEVGSLLDEFDAFLMPVAPTPAPAGLTSTGDSAFCVPWSAAGFPAIALPSGVSATGLPLAIQLVAAEFHEDRLLVVAYWCQKILDFSARPPEPGFSRARPS